MNKRIKILIVEHDNTDLDLLEHELVKGGINYEATFVQNENDYVNALKNFSPDIILSDYNFPSFNGIAAFRIKEESYPNIPFIFVSGTVGEEKAVELIKIGVTDYVLKDKLYTLPHKIRRALRDAEEKREKILTEEKLKKVSNLYAFISQVNQNIFQCEEHVLAAL